MNKDQSVTEVIGKNVKRLRTEQGLTAPQVGQKIGEVLGKVWARQTVYQVEAGSRAMAAEEVAALAQVLSAPIADLYAVGDAEAVRVGQVQVPATEWRVLPAASSVDDQVSLRLFHAAEQVEQSMRASKTLYDSLVRDVRAQVKASPALRERIEQEHDLAREQVRRDFEQLIGGTYDDAEIDANPSPRMTAARDILEG